jgi:hypothetical protein
MSKAIGLLLVLALSGDARKRAYYAAVYPNEHGPFVRRQDAIEAGLFALHARAEAGDWGCEWLTMFTRDRYGKWWYTTPKEGGEAGPGECQVSYSSREVRRPGSTLVATAHSHPRGDVFPDPRPDPDDNRNAQEMFLLRSDGNVWHFGPRQTRATLYGRMAADGLKAPESRPRS